MRNGRIHQRPRSQAGSRISVAVGGAIGQRVSLRVFTILISFAWIWRSHEMPARKQARFPMPGGQNLSW